MLLDKKKYIVWTDAGSHFRCCEFMHYLFTELANLSIQVSFNLFCEKHGKNSRDQHFSCVSNFIYNESMIKQLRSSQDICDAIERQQMLANLNTSRRNCLKRATTQASKCQQTKAFVIPQNSLPRIICS